MIDVKLFRIRFPKAPPVAISFHTWNDRESFLVAMSDGHHQGWGEATPFLPITGDCAEDLWRDYQKIEQIPLDVAKHSLGDFHSYFGKSIRSFSLLSALDCAYHDLIGKRKQQPCYQLYAETPYFAPSCITVFVQDSLEKTQEEAIRIFSNYPSLQVLKIKLTGNGDVARVKAIQNVASKEVDFVLDANQGFSDEKEAVEVLEEIQHILKRVIIVEEPCPKGELGKLRYVTENAPSGVLIFADESGANVEDAKEVIKNKAAHGINIKLQKAGGIYPAKQIYQMCCESGLKTMLGAMIEGPIAITAGAHCAASSHGLVVSDLDTDLDLPIFTKGHSLFEGGKKKVSDASGLGILIDNEKLEECIADGTVIWEEVGGV